MTIGAGIYYLAIIAGCVALVVTGHPWWALLLLFLAPEAHREPR